MIICPLAGWSNPERQPQLVDLDGTGEKESSMTPCSPAVSAAYPDECVRLFPELCGMEVLTSFMPDLPNTLVRWWCCRAGAADLLSPPFALQQGPFHGWAGAWGRRVYLQWYAARPMWRSWGRFPWFFSFSTCMFIPSCDVGHIQSVSALSVRYRHS
jgi:hypothetical protein